MKQGLCEIACIIDRSGSMEAVRHDAIGGFNAFLDEQKKLPGQANMSLILFSTGREVVYENAAIDSVPPLTEQAYVPRGSTALLDAVGLTIDGIGKRLAQTPEDHRPERVIVAILTDGEENASRKYTRAQVAERIKHQQEQYGWQFVFLAANMDAFAEAAALNIPLSNAANFAATREGTQSAYRDMSATVANLRAGPSSSADSEWHIKH